MKRPYIIFLLAFCSVALFAQDDDRDKRFKTEIGLNITNTLAGFFNSGGSGLSKDPYLFSLKFAGRKGALRFATNFKSGSNSEFLSSGTGRRDVKQSEAVVRGGFEFRKPIEHGFTIYYGLDGVIEIENEEVEFFSSNFEDIKSTKSTTGFGGGPVLGMQYQLSKHIALSTEASIYGVVQNRQETQEVGSGLPDIEDTSTGFRISPIIPSSLYLIMIF